MYYNYDNLEQLRKRFSERFPGVKVGDVQWGSWYCHHYIQFEPVGLPKGMHYEYSITQNTDWNKRKGVLEFHIESNNENREVYKRIGIRLMHLLSTGSGKTVECSSRRWLPFVTFLLQSNSIASIGDLLSA